MLECHGNGRLMGVNLGCDFITENTLVNNMVPHDFFNFAGLYKQTRVEYFMSMAYNYLL